MGMRGAAAHPTDSWLVWCSQTGCMCVGTAQSMSQPEGHCVAVAGGIAADGQAYS